MVYFAQAEIEKPAGVRDAPTPPAFLAPFLLHRVSQGDRRFSSRALRSVEHAVALLAQLRTRRHK